MINIKTENYKFFKHEKCEFFPCHEGITEKDFHTEWYLTGRKNQLLQELAESLGDVEMYKVARELKKVIQELNSLK